MSKLQNLFFYALLVFVFVIGFFTSFLLSSSAYYYNNSTATGTIVLGKANVLYSQTLPLFQGVSASPGQTLVYPIKVVNSNNATNTSTTGLIDCYLRFTISFISNGNNVDVVTPNLSNSPNWIFAPDNYYYYKNVFFVGQELPLIESFTLADTISLEVLENGVDVTILTETIQTQGNAYQTQWGTAPSIW